MLTILFINKFRVTLLTNNVTTVTIKRDMTRQKPVAKPKEPEPIIENNDIDVDERLRRRMENLNPDIVRDPVVVEHTACVPIANPRNNNNVPQPREPRNIVDNNTGFQTDDELEAAKLYRLYQERLALAKQNHKPQNNNDLHEFQDREVIALRHQYENVIIPVIDNQAQRLGIVLEKGEEMTTAYEKMITKYRELIEYIHKLGKWQKTLLSLLSVGTLIWFLFKIGFHKQLPNIASLAGKAIGGVADIFTSVKEDNVDMVVPETTPSLPKLSEKAVEWIESLPITPTTVLGAGMVILAIVGTGTIAGIIFRKPGTKLLQYGINKLSETTLKALETTIKNKLNK